MAQRPRLDQIKRDDINFLTFKEQFRELETNTKQFRRPVRTKGELPFSGNIDGTQCLVVEDGVMYYWDEAIQNWQPIVGQVFKMETATFKRWRKRYVATANQTDFSTDVLFDVGEGEVDVYIQGILQDIDVDYIEIDNHTIRFLEGLPEGASVTIATPMIVESTTSIETYLKRLEDLEFNNYQMMMIQYYDGKGFKAQGMVYDGFINTEYIDYSSTTSNVRYDPLRKSMYLFNLVDTGIKESFNKTDNIDESSTVNVSNSEITLPISSVYERVFTDDFSTQNFMNTEKSNVFWDAEKHVITTNSDYSGGSHYYKGDFMGSTGSVDALGFSEDISVTYYYNSSGNTNSINANRNSYCYGVLAMGTHTTSIGSHIAIWKSAWPHTSYDRHYRGGNSRCAYVRGGIGGYNLFGDNSDSLYYKMTYVAKSNKIFALKQDIEGDGRYYQRLLSSPGRSAGTAFSPILRPTGLPKDMFGSETTIFTGSRRYISQIGSTYEHLLLRVDNVLYFLDDQMNLVKTLDWSDAKRPPSNYTSFAHQMTADKRYLYFPARLVRDGVTGYYLEIFEIEDGSFVGEVLVTKNVTSITTAMGFDHAYNRLILAQNGTNKYELESKAKRNISNDNVYANFLLFESPNILKRELISKPLVTNLPRIKYALHATEVLNGGTIDYYIRFNNQAWNRINRSQELTWINPNGAKEITIEIRAELTSASKSSKSPELTDWHLFVCPFNKSGMYRSKPLFMNMEKIDGGKLKTSQTVPNETSLRWFVETDSEDNRYYVGQNGTFSIPLTTGDANLVLEAAMETNDNLLSPTVQDVQAEFYRDDTGALYTETRRQFNNIRETSIWVTTSAGNENYAVDVSRDGGLTWFKATKKDSIQITNGNIETNWYYNFKKISVEDRDFKIRFRINGSTEILQYGAKIN